jgi:hypothetical protein
MITKKYNGASLNMILGITFIILLAVVVKQNLNEGFSTEKDSDLVAFVKYMWFFLSQLAFWLVQLPYLWIKMIVRLPKRIFKPIWKALKPMIQEFINAYYDFRYAMQKMFKRFQQIAKDMYRQFQNLPRDLLKMMKRYIQQLKNMVEMFGQFTNAMYDIMNVMMNIPFTMINAFTKMSGFLFKLPRMFLTLPDKGVDMMMNFTDQMVGMMG